MLGPHHCVYDGPSIAGHTSIQTVPLELWEKKLSEVGQQSYTVGKKKAFFHRFLTKTDFFFPGNY